MSLPAPPTALLRLSRKVISLLGNGINKYIVWQLPQCNISSNPYGGSTGVYGLINCVAIQNGAVSAVVWFYITKEGQGTLLSFQNAQYPSTPSYTTPWLYIGTDGILRAGDYAGGIWQVSTSSALQPGWHMAVIEEWYSGGTYYLALYIDGALVGLNTTTTLPQLFGANVNYPYNDIGVGYTTSSWSASNNTWFFFNGAIAYVALYNRVLSSSEVSTIYQGNRITNGLVAEFVGDNYDTSTGSWLDDVNGYIAGLVVQSNVPSVIDSIITEFTSGINYDLLAQKIAERISGKPINIANLPINQYGNLYIDINTIANNLKSWFSVLSNASITSNGSSSNYNAGPYRNFLVTIYVGSVSGTSPSLTVYFNAYDTNSGQSIPLASVTLTGAGGTYIYVHDFPGNAFNISWTVGGTSPSFGSVFISVYESL